MEFDNNTCYKSIFFNKRPGNKTGGLAVVGVLERGSESRERQREPESNDTRCEAPESSSAFLLTKMESDGRFSVAECPYPI